MGGYLNCNGKDGGNGLPDMYRRKDCLGWVTLNHNTSTYEGVRAWDVFDTAKVVVFSYQQARLVESISILSDHVEADIEARTLCSNQS